MSSQVRALVLDYGGVLTEPLAPSFAAWAAESGVDGHSLGEALADWIHADAPDGNPVHRLETGALTLAEFETLLAPRLRGVDGGQVALAGLMARVFDHVHLDAAMLHLLRRARAAGLATAMLSNSWGNDYPMDVLAPLLDVSVVSGEVGLRKPDPAIYRHTLDALGLAPHEAVFVDDLAVNVDAATALGMHAVLHTDAETTARVVTALAGPLPATA